MTRNGRKSSARSTEQESTVVVRESCLNPRVLQYVLSFLSQKPSEDSSSVPRAGGLCSTQEVYVRMIKPQYMRSRATNTLSFNSLVFAIVLLECLQVSPLCAIQQHVHTFNVSIPCHTGSMRTIA